MPTLRNPKHEAMAKGLAEGRSQMQAYSGAGYRPDKGAASRLANDARIKARVEELKMEKFLDVKPPTKEELPEGMTEEEQEAFLKQDHHSLLSMGVSIWWIAQQYKNIYTESMKKKQHTAAIKAIENLQKMVEQEKEAGSLEAVDTKKVADDRVSISAVTDLLREFKEVTKQSSVKDPAEEAKDVTEREHASEVSERRQSIPVFEGIDDS